MPGALPVEPHEHSGEVHQPALLAEDDVEEVPVLALPFSPPQSHLCLLILTVPVSLSVPRNINPGINFLSVETFRKLFPPPMKPLHVLVHQLWVLVVVDEDEAEVAREDETVVVVLSTGVLLLHAPLGRGSAGQTGTEHLLASHLSQTEQHSQAQDDHHPAQSHVHVLTFKVSETKTRKLDSLLCCICIALT